MSVDDLGAELSDVIFTSRSVSACPHVWASGRACDDHVMSEVKFEIAGGAILLFGKFVSMNDFFLIYGKYCFAFIVKMH